MNYFVIFIEINAYSFYFFLLSVSKPKQTRPKKTYVNYFRFKLRAEVRGSVFHMIYSVRFTRNSSSVRFRIVVSLSAPPNCTTKPFPKKNISIFNESPITDSPDNSHEIRFRSMAETKRTIATKIL